MSRDDIIRTYYPDGGSRACHEAGLCMTAHKIRNRAWQLGIKYMHRKPQCRPSIPKPAAVDPMARYWSLVLYGRAA